MAAQMVDGENLALVATRQVTRPQFEHAFVSRDIIEIKACSHDRNTQIFPLFLREDGELAFGSETIPNLNQKMAAEMALHLGMKWQGGALELGKEDELTPRRLFGYAYAILNCPSYRLRYFEFLRSDFPRLPLSAGRQLFGSLAKLGGELVALHLLESPILDKLEKYVHGPDQTRGRENILCPRHRMARQGTDTRVPRRVRGRMGISHWRIPSLRKMAQRPQGPHSLQRRGRPLPEDRRRNHRDDPSYGGNRQSDRSTRGLAQRFHNVEELSEDRITA